MPAMLTTDFDFSGHLQFPSPFDIALYFTLVCNYKLMSSVFPQAQSLGGKCVPVVCDSSQENEVRSLFERVAREQNGRLDVLVNNAFSGVQVPFDLIQLRISYLPLWPHSLSPPIPSPLHLSVFRSSSHFPSLYLLVNPESHQ